jgi:hypothetical protein
MYFAKPLVIGWFTYIYLLITFSTGIGWNWLICLQFIVQSEIIYDFGVSFPGLYASFAVTSYDCLICNISWCFHYTKFLLLF